MACLECDFFKLVEREEKEAVINFYKKIKEFQAKISQQNSMISNASRLSALGEMSAGIAHEINNPLSNMAKNDSINVESIKNIIEESLNFCNERFKKYEINLECDESPPPPQFIN